MLYHCSRQHKNIKNLQFTEQNIVISFCPSLCLLWLVLLPPFSMVDVIRFLDTVRCEILNNTSDHLCHCIKNHVYNNFNLGRLYSSARMRNSTYEKYHNFQRVPLFSILYNDFLKFLENRYKWFKLRSTYFNFLRTGNYITSCALVI